MDDNFLEGIDICFIKKSTAYFGVKRLLDILLASIGLVASLPVMFIFGSAAKLESEGPVIYRQERVGRMGRCFIIYKLRSMYLDAEKNGAQWASKDDPRITGVGGFIRRTRIDEIPQLINILKGDMSIVGPRPERPEFIDEFSRRIPNFKYRLAVKPGLTGLAQINGGYDLTPEEKLKLDMLYIENLSIWLDIKIIFRTIKIIFTGCGAR